MSNQSRREALRAQQLAQAEAARRKRVMTVVAIVTAVVVLVGGGGLLIYLNRDSISPSGGTAAMAPPNANADQSGIIVNPGKAKPGAPVVVVYQDYQCPWCKTFDLALGPKLLAKAEAGEITLEYHTMTFLDSNLRNDASTRAGIAAACSDVVGAYAAYHDVIYANQPQSEGIGYSDQNLRNAFAAQAGITGDKLVQFQRCYDSKATAAFVKGTNEKAGRAGVTGTPTYFLNGKDVTKQLNYQDPSSLDRVLATA